MRAESASFDIRLCALHVMAAIHVLLSLSAPAAAEAVRIAASVEGERARLTLKWQAPVELRSEVRDGRLILHFDRPVDGNLAAAGTLSKFVGTPTLDNGGRTLSFPLEQGTGGLAYADDRSVFVDFMRQKAATSDEATARGQPPDAGAIPIERVRVQTGQHRQFSRILFSWDRPVGYRIERIPEGMAIEFDRPAEIDAQNFERRYLKYVRGGASRRSDTATRVELRISADSDVRDAREGRNIVIDVLAPVTRPQMPEQTATAPPAPAAPLAPPTPPADSQAPPASEVPSDPALPPVETSQAEHKPAAPSPVPAAPVLPGPPELPVPTSPPVQAQVPEPAALRIAWDQPVAAVVFRREGVVWAIFDQASKRDTEALAQTVRGSVLRIDQRPHPRATILRIETRADAIPRVEREGLAWILRFGNQQQAVGASIVPMVAEDGSKGPRLLLPVSQPGEPLALDDPAESETMVVVPVIPLAAHVDQPLSYPQFHLARTIQGIVVQPRIDTLRVRALADGVEISSSDGLAVSPGGTDDSASASDRLLEPADWDAGAGGRFVAKRQALERDIVAAAPADRERLRLRLGQFLLGQGFAIESIGALQVAAQHRPDLAEDPSFLLLRGAAQLLAARGGAALDDLQKAQAADPRGEVRMWVAAARTAAGEPVNAATLEALPQWTAMVLSYPPPLRGPLAALLAEAAIVAGREEDGERLIKVARQTAKSTAAQSNLVYLEGRRRERRGDTDGAIAAYQEAIRLDPRRGRAQAQLALTQLLLRHGRISNAEAATTLEGLRHAWRGDALEFQVLRELGRLRLQAGDHAAGLRALKLAVSEYSKLSGAAEATRLMAATFERLFLEGGADEMPPVAALGLWDEFKELTPPGDKGREMVRKLADRLVAVDLLDRAAALLESLLPTASGVEGAALGSRLAEVRMLDDKPEAALDALARTPAAGAPADLARARALTQARALLALGRSDEALSVVERDDGLEAELLRAKVYRAKGEWARAASSLHRIVDAARADPQQPLDDRQARDVLDLAVALTLAGNTTQLAQLDASYRKPMAETALNDVFRLIAGTVPPQGADAAALAELVEKAMAFRRSLAPAAGVANAPK
jgi:tetratricopeptide (TPR) repeat protein